MARLLVLAACAACVASAACGGGSGTPAVASRWKYDAPSDAAPPGIGPERRVIVALMSGQGSVLTLDEQTGRKVEGPFMPLFPTSHGPAVSASKIMIVSSIGKIVAIDFGGHQIFAKPDMNGLGVTGPLQVAPDGSLRIAATSGHLFGLSASDGSTIFDAPIQGAAVSPLAIAGDGTTFAATDTGQITGFDAMGNKVFDQTVHAPASGPSVSSDGKVAVGEGDGLRVFDKSGTQVFMHPRAARVVGTSFIAGGGVIAWGEDGVFEILDGAGGVVGSFNAGPPIYAEAIALASKNFAVVDRMGGLHLVDPKGKEIAHAMLPGQPLDDLVQGPSTGYLIMTVGRSIFGIDFQAMQ
jgi:outer membrane protein assembly factor BamB